MALIDNPISSVIDLGTKLLDKFVPDPAQRDAAKLAMLNASQNGELELVKANLSAINTEAASADPWTSRARPSFMYVIYIMLLMGIPMGFLSAFEPAMATAVAGGFKAWLTAIPDSLYTLFGVGYVGYAGARTIDKIKGGTK